MAALYLPTLGADFVWDDLGLVKPSPALRDFQGLRVAMSTDLYRQADPSLKASSYWRPLALASFWLDSRLGPPPRSLHAGNIALHALATLLLFLVLVRRLGSDAVVPSALAAGWWALHPEQVEAVAWISCRYELLSAVALLALVLLPRRPGPGNAAAYGLAFLAGLLSKDAFAPAALVVAADDWAERRSLRSIALRWGALSAAAAIWAAARARLAVPAPGFHLSFSLAKDLLASAGIYGWRALWPLPLTTAHPYVPGGGSALVWGALALLGVAAAAAHRSRLAVPAAVVFAGLIPAALAMGTFGLAPDRYFYVPSIGLALLLGEGLCARKAAPQALRAASLASVGVWCLVGAALAAPRVREWRTSGTLFRATLRVDPGDPQANLALANEAGLAGRWEEARALLERAQQRDPESARVANALARVHLERRDAVRALALAERATALDPERPQSWLYVAWAHRLAGDRAGELEALERALRLSPGYADARAARERVVREMSGKTSCPGECSAP